MKCPYCGAEVKPNSYCEYCGSFVKEASDPSYTTDQTKEECEKLLNETEDFINKRLFSANKRIIKMVLFAALVIAVILPLASVNFFKHTTSTSSDYDSQLSAKEEDMISLHSLTNAKGTILEFHYDGRVTIEYNGDTYSTRITDTELLEWMELTGRNPQGVGTEFTTNSDGDILSMALSSDTFFVAEQENGIYLIIRDDYIFKATAKPDIQPGGFYDGYMNYPNINIHSATPAPPANHTLFSPVCEGKQVKTVSDAYTEEELSLCQIRIDDEWYYCCRELYDLCEEDVSISQPICCDSNSHIAYLTD